MSRRYPLLLSLVLGILLSGTGLFAATISETIAMLNSKDTAWIEANATRRNADTFSWQAIAPTTRTKLSTFLQDTYRSAHLFWRLENDEVLYININHHFVQVNRLNSDFNAISHYRYEVVPASADLSSPSYVLTDQWNYVEVEAIDGHIVVRVNKGDNLTREMLDTRTDTIYDTIGSKNPLPIDAAGNLIAITGYEFTQNKLPDDPPRYTYKAQPALYFDTTTPTVLADFETNATQRRAKIQTEPIRITTVTLWGTTTEKPSFDMTKMLFTNENIAAVKAAFTPEMAHLLPRVDAAKQQLIDALSNRIPALSAQLSEQADALEEKIDLARQDSTATGEKQLTQLNVFAREKYFLTTIAQNIGATLTLFDSLNEALEQFATSLGTVVPEAHNAVGTVSDTLAMLNNAAPEWIASNTFAATQVMGKTGAWAEKVREPEWVSIPTVDTLTLSTFVKLNPDRSFQISFRMPNGRGFGFKVNENLIYPFQMNDGFGIDGRVTLNHDYTLSLDRWYYLETTISQDRMVVTMHDGTGSPTEILNWSGSNFIGDGFVYYYGKMAGYSFSLSDYTVESPQFFAPQVGTFYDSNQLPPTLLAFRKEAGQKLTAIEAYDDKPDDAASADTTTLIFDEDHIATLLEQFKAEPIAIANEINQLQQDLKDAVAQRSDLWSPPTEPALEQILTQDTLTWHEIPAEQQPFVRVKVRPTGPSFKGHTALRFHLAQSSDTVQQNSFGVSLLNNFAFVALFDNTGHPSAYKTYSITPLANDEWHTLEIGTNGTDISVIKINDDETKTAILNTQTDTQVGGTIPKDQPVITDAVIDKYNIGHIYSDHQYHYQPPMLFTPEKSLFTTVTTINTPPPTNADQELTANERYTAFQTTALTLSDTAIKEMPLESFLTLSEDGALDLRLNTLATIDALNAAGMSDEATDAQETHNHIERKITERSGLIRTAQQLLSDAQADARERITQAKKATTLAELPSAAFENEDAIRDALTAAHLTEMIPLIKQGKDEFNALLTERSADLTPTPLTPGVTSQSDVSSDTTDTAAPTTKSDTTTPDEAVLDEVDEETVPTVNEEELTASASEESITTTEPATVTEATETDTPEQTTTDDSSQSDESSEAADTGEEVPDKVTEETTPAIITPADDGAITIAQGFTQPADIIDETIVFAADSSSGITLRLTNAHHDSLTLTLDRTGQTRIMQNATSVGFNRELSFGSSDANPGDYPLTKHIYKVHTTTTIDGDDTYLYIHLTKYVDEKAERPIRSAPMKVTAVPTQVSFGTLGSTPVTLKKLVIAPNEPEGPTSTSVNIDASGVVTPPVAEDSVTPPVRTYLPVAQRMRRR